MVAVDVALHRWRWRFLLAWVILFTGLTAWSFHQAANQRDANGRLARQTNMSLCTLRADLEQRVASSEAFLRERPQGFDGITPTLIRTGIASERGTIAALSNLNCKEGTP